MERLHHGEGSDYHALESAIHINRYAISKEYCKDKKVLDIACGEGYGSYLISLWGAQSVIGLDISEESIKIARKLFLKDNIEFIQQDVEDLSRFEDHSFDLIVSFETIEHLNNPENFLKEIKRVIKKDGTIIISCPNDYYYYPTKDTGNPYHVRKYTYKEYKELTGSILGEADIDLVGLPVLGFSNIKKPNENKDNEDNTQTRGLNLSITQKTFQIPMDSAFDMKRVAYFISIWSKEKKPEETLAYYPALMEESHTNTPDYYEENQRRLEEIRLLSEEIRLLSEEIRLLSEEIRLLSEEIRLLKGDNFLKNQQLIEQDGKIEKLATKYYKEKFRHESLASDLKGIKRIYEKRIEEYEVYDERTGMLVHKRLEQIYNSRSYKFLLKLQSIKDRLMGGKNEQ